jgi:hypothetical protein
MKITSVEAVYHANSIHMRFFDVDKAKVAYDKISLALKEYRLFKNDKAETVEVDSENGLTTLKLERLDAVLISLPDENDGLMRDALETEKRGRAMRAELGLPELENKHR